MNTTKKRFIYQLLFLLFTTSISFTSISGTTYASYNLFGQVAQVSISETDVTTTISPNSYGLIVKKKAPYVINPWLLLFILVILLIFIIYSFLHPITHTLITWKVRLDC